MRVQIFHPSVAPFVQQAALAFQEGSLLDHYYTAVAYQPESVWQQTLFRCGRLAGFPFEEAFQKRDLESALKPFVKTRPLPELLRLFTSRVNQSGVWTDLIWEWGEKGFDQWVAAQLSKKSSLVYGYEHACLSTFQRAKTQGIRTIYDVPAPETTRVRSLMEEAMKEFPDLQSDWFEATSRKEPRRLQRRKKEWQLAEIGRAHV